MGLDNLPSINDLREEYSALAQEKHNCQQAINGIKQLVSDLQSAKKNVEILLGIEDEPANERTQRKGLHTLLSYICSSYYHKQSKFHLDK